MTFGEAVAKRTRELLFKFNKTQYRLVKETCLDKNTIQNIMKGKTVDIKLSTCFLIADFFGMSLTEFFNAPYFNRENIIT